MIAGISCRNELARSPIVDRYIGGRSRVDWFEPQSPFYACASANRCSPLTIIFGDGSTSRQTEISK